MAQDQGVFSIKPKDLKIVWGNDSRYWRLPDQNGEGPAELLQVCWLEVTGSIQNLVPGKTYQISFKISLKPEAFGWSGCPVFLMAKVGKKGKYTWKRMKPLDQLNLSQPESIPQDKFLITVPSDERESELHFGLYEVWSGKWKGGLVIHEACIREDK